MKFLSYKKPKIRFELRLVFFYLVLGGLWILFSDQILQNLAPDKGTLSRLQTYKGWFFVASSGILLYLLVRWYNHQLTREMENLKTARRKAEESDQLKSSFLQNVSHEIRTPLNSIIGFSEILRNSPEITEKNHQFLDRIISGGDDLLRFVNKILDISLIDTGQIQIHPASIEFGALVDELKNEFQFWSEIKPGLHFEVQCQPCLLPQNFSQDKILIQKILSNLIENAFKYTESGIIRLRIQKSGEGEFCFIVSDSGPGIETSKQSLIFERFRQADESNEKSGRGAGMGLYIVNQLTSLLKGKLEYETSPNRGTTFRIYLKNLKHDN